MICDHRSEDGYRAYAETDLRMICDLKGSLDEATEFEAARKWARQIAITWSSRLGAAERFRFRRLFNLFDSIGR